LEINSLEKFFDRILKLDASISFHIFSCSLLNNLPNTRRLHLSIGVNSEGGARGKLGGGARGKLGGEARGKYPQYFLYMRIISLATGLKRIK